MTLIDLIIAVLNQPGADETVVTVDLRWVLLGAAACYGIWLTWNSPNV